MLIQATGVKLHTRRRPPVAPSGRAGFTMVELLVVIAIIGVLVAITYGNITASLPLWRLKDATNTVTQMLQQARFHAVKNNTPVIVTIDIGASTISTSFDDDRDGTGDTAVLSVSISDKHRNSSITSSDACGTTATTFCFYPDGTIKWVGAYGTKGTMPVIITLANSDYTGSDVYQSVLDRSGISRVAKNYTGICATADGGGGGGPP